MSSVSMIASRRLMSMTRPSVCSRSLNKMTATSNHNSVAIRALSSERGHDAASRLHEALEEYRQIHYTQELPNRFKKDIITAACAAAQTSSSSAASVSLEGLQRVLRNIGMMDRLSQKDLQVIFEEEGNEQGAIPADRLAKLL